MSKLAETVAKHIRSLALGPDKYNPFSNEPAIRAMKIEAGLKFLRG